MKNSHKNLIITGVVMFAIGFGLNGIATSANAPANVAVVNVSAVVNKSAQVQALKKEQAAKMSDLSKWLKVAKEDVQKQQTKEGREKLLQKYDADFAKKKEAISKDYQARLQVIDKSITQTIATEAQKRGYTLVLSKSVVLFGGNDITSEVAKVVK